MAAAATLTANARVDVRLCRIVLGFVIWRVVGGRICRVRVSLLLVDVDPELRDVEVASFAGFL